MADTEKIAPTGPGGNNPPIPTRSQRKACHAKRDEYFACLDKNAIDDPEKAGAVCSGLRKAMYAECPESWADYFGKLRVMQKQKEQFFKADGSFNKPSSSSSAKPNETKGGGKKAE
ncbi:hypothetical protein IW140_000134 [Coemansia sp. RSA 1813]|nr:hypothetical protein EV178_000061 [Coemansia sp. RSA 1646]KAJ1772299.1 hypothetical protein LPJ74_001564 [Coemansia sp. RSA 1843]KAJ2093240.1 hypothetical protein IW138_000533 [Coemansia sp. RSA 986]KAJ2217496.1 hypothetical protein EV179_000330 [Coemansia sp. RSA 487]KAJ2573492.1 hypothetical protein IW140_000134 [Coemansia sp. RSA 1813]